MHLDGRSVIQSIPLSNDTVARRINLMASGVETTLCSILKTTEFSLQIDESTLPGDEALLLAYVRIIHEEIMVKEMLFARPLVTDKKGEYIYKVGEILFQEKEIPMYNIIASAMVGRHRGFISYLKNVLPEVSLFTASFIENIWSQNILVVACTTHCNVSLLLSIKSKLPHSRKENFANYVTKTKQNLNVCFCIPK